MHQENVNLNSNYDRFDKSDGNVLSSNEEDFHRELSHRQDNRGIFKKSKHPQHCLTPYEEEFMKQSKASSSSKLNGSPLRRTCQSNNQVNSFSPTNGPRRFISVENNATKFTNNVVMPDTKSPKRKNPLTTEKNDGGEKRKRGSDENIQSNHESQV